MAEVMETMDRCEIPPNYMLEGGPSNVMVVHGRAEGRGMGGEKRLVEEGVGKIRVEYHLTELVRRSMKETEKLQMVQCLMRDLKKMCRGAQVIYIGLFPRHVQPSCKEVGHMRQEDIGAMHIARKEFD
jgi:hypothetical protein